MHETLIDELFDDALRRGEVVAAGAEQDGENDPETADDVKSILHPALLT
jgi:hypothetical protein